MLHVLSVLLVILRLRHECVVLRAQHVVAALILTYLIRCTVRRFVLLVDSVNFRVHDSCLLALA